MNKSERSEVYKAIDGERSYQNGWDDPLLTDTCGRHTYTEFLVYIKDYADEALHIATRRPDPEARVQNAHALRKIAALAVAALEQNGVLERDPGERLVDKFK